MTGRILVVDDEVTILRMLSQPLADEGHAVRVASSGAEARAAIEEELPDVALVDLKLPDDSGLDLLVELKGRAEEITVVLMTAHGDVETAVRAMKAGATDYLTKPVNISQLKLIVDKSLERHRLWRELRHHRETQTRRLASGLIRGKSERFHAVLSIAERVALSDSTSVLLEGESGTGKQVLASLIHNLSSRCGHPFVELNCAAIPSELLETELFGHERGAFTDAKEAKEGLLEAADGGTLFLDEIGEMPATLQVKLLKVLETMRFRRVGGTRDVNVNVRIISATNRNLLALCESGGFREDLYYRLKVVPLVVPPLRERGDDVVVFAKHFLHAFSNQFGKRFSGMSEDAERVLLSHRWPGNIRELRNLFERVVLLEDSERLESHHLGLAPGDEEPGERDLLARLGAIVRERRVPRGGIPFRSLVEELERLLIRVASERTGWNQSRTAELLGLGRDKLRYRMKLHGIRRPTPREGAHRPWRAEDEEAA